MATAARTGSRGVSDSTRRTRHTPWSSSVRKSRPSAPRRTFTGQAGLSSSSQTAAPAVRSPAAKRCSAPHSEAAPTAAARAGVTSLRSAATASRAGAASMTPKARTAAQASVTSASRASAASGATDAASARGSSALTSCRRDGPPAPAKAARKRSPAFSVRRPPSARQAMPAVSSVFSSASSAGRDASEPTTARPEQANRLASNEASGANRRSSAASHAARSPGSLAASQICCSSCRSGPASAPDSYAAAGVAAQPKRGTLTAHQNRKVFLCMSGSFTRTRARAARVPSSGWLPRSRTAPGRGPTSMCGPAAH